MTDANTVTAGLASLGASGWAINEVYTKDAEILASDFGAYGFGRVDESTQLQAAITAAATYRIPLKLKSKGIYLIGTPLQIPSDVEIRGSGAAFGMTQLRSIGDNAILTNTAALAVRVVLRDMMIDHRGGHNGSSYAVDFVDMYMLEVDNVRITSGTSTLRNFRGLRLRKSDSLRFLNLHITECRGQAYAIGYNTTQVAFFGCSFESDSGVAATWNEIDAYALHGDSAPTNYQGNGEGIQFFGCQHERQRVYINHPGVIFDNGGGGQVDMQLGPQCRRVSLRDYAAPVSYLNFSSPHVSFENIDVNSGSLDSRVGFDLANVADGSFRVYGAGREYLLLPVVYARSATVTGAGYTATADVAGLLETSDTKDLLQMVSATAGTAGRDEFCLPTLLEVPAGNNYMTLAPVGTTAGLKLYAYPNLLTNGDFTAGTAVTGWTAANHTPAFSGGWVQFSAAAANPSLRQTGITGLKTGHRYALMARVKGTNVQLACGNVTDGTVGAREAMANSSGVRTAQYADGSYILSCIFEATGARTDVSLGYLGTPANTIEVKWIGLVDLGVGAATLASSSQAFAASFTPVYQAGKSEQIIRVGQMTANMTALNLGNTSALQVDDQVTFIFQQDATAGRTIAFNAGYRFQNAWTNAIVTTDASKYSQVTFRWDGTNFRQMSPANVWVA